MVNVLSICSSLRKGSYNRMVMKLLPGLAPSEMTITEAPSFAEFPLYNADIQNSTGFPVPVNMLAATIRAADGVIFCTPEYNFSLPGGLKNAIDWVSRLPNQPFAGKPIAIQSASPGPLGGGRVQYDLRRAMVFLDAFTLNKPEIFIGSCAVAGALLFCGLFQLVMPEWLWKAASALVLDKQTPAERERLRDNAIHHLRYLTVRLFKYEHGAKGDRKWDLAAERLKGTPAAGERETIKRSYSIVHNDACADFLGKYFHCKDLHDSASGVTLESLIDRFVEQLDQVFMLRVFHVDTIW